MTSFNDAQTRLLRLERLLRLTRGALELDPGLALAQIRLVTEQLLREVIEESTSEDWSRKALDALAQRARELNLLNGTTLLHIRTVRQFGNSAVHGRLGDNVTVRDAEPALAALIAIVDWYCCGFLATDSEQHD